MILWDQEDFVDHMTEKIGDLNGHDLVEFAQRGIQVYPSLNVRWGAKAAGLAYDIEAGLCEAHPVRVCATSVGEFLPIFIVLLFAYAEHGEDNVVIGCGMNINRALTGCCCETEVVENDRQLCHKNCPIGGH